MILPAFAGILLVALPSAWSESTTLETLCDRVIDGWTLHSPDFGEIRLLDIEALEGKEKQALGERIRTELASLVQGKAIKLEFESPAQDAQGRLLAYVQVGETLLNVWMLKNGYARVSRSTSYLKHRALFQDLQKEAQDHQRGIWAPVKAVEEKRPAPKKEKIIASTKTRYYYRPGQDYYHKVDPKFRVVFDSEEEALEAGFRPYVPSSKRPPSPMKGKAPRKP